MNKKELVITDFMDLPTKRGGKLHFVKRGLRKIYHAFIPRKKLIHVSRKGIHFVLSKTDGVGEAVLVKGRYEHQQVLYLFNAARRQGADIFLDIGANIGYYSLMATKTSDFTEIHAIEPHPETYRRLLMQIEANAFQSIITPHNIAVSDKRGELFIDCKNSGEASVSSDKRQDTIAIKAAALDSLFDFVGRNIAIKLDVEGHEIEALKGMINLLSRNKVLLQVEIWSQSMDSFYWLHDNGFRCIYYVKKDFYFVNDNKIRL